MQVRPEPQTAELVWGRAYLICDCSRFAAQRIAQGERPRSFAGYLPLSVMAPKRGVNLVWGFYRNVEALRHPKSRLC